MDFIDFILSYNTKDKVDYWRLVYSLYKDLRENKDYKKLALEYNTSYENVKQIAKKLKDRNLI